MSDQEVVQRQLGRPPRAFRRVAVRCPFGRPAVTEQNPYDRLGEPFPTTYYLTCPHLVAAVIYQESKFDADAVSSSGAVGLMQLLPSTGQGIADRTGGDSWTPEDLHNPELNVRYGSWYLRHLLDKYEDEELALAAYNAGQANVDRWREEGLGPTRSEIARAAPAPVLFVRRGTRPGALAPREDVTRFSWSGAGAGEGFTPGAPLG